jgi:endonuclease/exonuclease/phosphatase family metal-dependent hydrolase
MLQIEAQVTCKEAGHVAQGPGFGTALAGVVAAVVGYYGWQSGYIDPAKASAWVSAKLSQSGAASGSAGQPQGANPALNGAVGLPAGFDPSQLPLNGAALGLTPEQMAQLQARAAAFQQGTAAPPGASGLLTNAAATSTSGIPANAAAGSTQAIMAPADGQRPVRLATFNIENFGPSKADKPDVMQVLAAICGWCDLVAIQEVSSSKRDVVGELVQVINRGGRHYSYAVSARVGNGNAAEQYAYVWDGDRIEANPQGFFTVDDRNDRINREPFVGSFRARTPQGNGFSFTMITVHTDPDETKSEIEALAAVWENVRMYIAPEDDLFLVGDMNVSADKLAPFRRFPGVDTIVGGFYTNAARNRDIDHIIIDRYATVEYTGRTGSIDFVQNMQQDPTFARGISDHYPLWAEFSMYEGQPAGQLANGQAAAQTGAR